MSRLHLFGVPLSQAERIRDFAALSAHLSNGHNETMAVLDSTLNRVTEKSVGLLQAVSLFFGVSLLFAEGQAGGFSPLVAAGAAALIAAAVILAANLRMAWWKDEHALFGTPAHLERTTRLIASRTLRFSVALYLSMAGFLVLGGALLAKLLGFGGN